MKKGNRMIFLGLTLLFLPTLALADCIDASRVTDYYIQGSHDFILYNKLTPAGYINVPWCNIFSNSRIRITTGYICDGDKVLIDGEACDIFSVKTSSTPQ